MVIMNNKVEACHTAALYLRDTGITRKRSQTSREKCLIILVVVFVVFLLFIKYNQARGTATAPKDVSLTSECLESAFYLANNSNASVDPLEYCNEFTCRHWVAQHPINDAANDIHSSFLNRHESEQTMKGLYIVDDRTAPEAARRTVANLKTSYKSGKTMKEICRTFDCLKSGTYIPNNIDTTVGPCKDFYQFACGRWIKENPIPRGYPGFGKPDLAGFVAKETVKELLNVDDITAPDAVQNARSYFRSCMDVDTLKMLGLQPLVDFLDGASIYPTLQSLWTDTGMTFLDIVEYLSNVGDIRINSFVPIGVIQDQMHSEKNIIMFFQATVLLEDPSDYKGIRSSTALMHLQSTYVYIHLMLGADPITATQDAKDVVDFEIKLAKAIVPREAKNFGVQAFDRMTVADLTDRFPQFDWLSFLRNKFNTRTKQTLNITMDEVVAIDSLKYYDNLFDLVDKTPTRTLLNYGMWRHVAFLSQFLDPDFREILYGSEVREILCFSHVQDYFPFAVGRMYVDQMFSPQDKLKVENITESLITAFKKMIKDVRWLSQATKTVALKKLSSMNRKIGYPDFVLDDQALDLESDRYFVNEDDFFWTSFKSILQRNHDALQNLRSPVVRTEWGMPIYSVNAYYSPSLNEIAFPAGILTLPFYVQNFTDAVLYGAVGTVIAHEITHAFHGTGAKFDEKRNLREWWRPKDLKIFQNRTQCLVDQYNEFVDKDLNLHVNGLLTLDENIADNFALKAAFKAYRSVIKERGREDDKYPSLPYTPDQLFFIGFAQAWCSNYGPELRKEVLMYSHSPNDFRVIGSVQNNKDFGRVFNCPVGKPMNPKHKCEVW